MNILKRSNLPNNNFAAFCDRGMIFSLCALIFILPVSIALLDSFAALAIFFYLLKKGFSFIYDWPGKTSQPINILDRPLQFLTLAVFISVLLSQYPALSLAAFLGKFLKGVFLYLSFIEVFTTDKRIRLFLNIFLGSALVVALAGVVEYYWGVDFLRKHMIGISGRVNSSFSTSNGLGAYLVPVIGLTAQFLYASIGKHRSWVLKAILVILLILLMSCLCWTYSRSSWVGFLGMLGFMVGMDRRKILYVGALLLVLVFVFLPSLNQVRHMSLIKDNESEPFWEQGGSGRIEFWKRAISVIKMSPVWGTGLNTYTKIIKRNPDPKTWWYAHNCYLQLTAETGLLGLGCFLWVLFVLFKQGVNVCRLTESLWPLTFLQGALAGLFGFLVQSFFDNTFFTVQLGVLLWMLIGLSVAIIRLSSINAGKSI